MVVRFLNLGSSTENLLSITFKFGPMAICAVAGKCLIVNDRDIDIPSDYEGPMTEPSVMDKMRQMALRQPETQTLSRPTVKAIRCELEFDRPTAERMFKSLVFDEGENTVTITEVLRMAKPGEAGIFFHTGAGVNFCVDHYEIDGVIL